MSSDALILRPAAPGDAAAIARLVVMAGGGVFEFLLDGLLPGVGAAEMMTPGIAGTTGSMSHRRCAVVSQGDRIAGVALGYPAVWMRGEERGFIPADRLAHLATFDEAQDWDSYFLSALAVDPAWRRRGVAGRLLAATEARARAEGFDRVTLHVWADNAPARSLYAAHGFEAVTVAAIAPHPRLPRHGGSILMRKAL